MANNAPDDYDGNRKKFKYIEDGDFSDPPQAVDSTTQGIITAMKQYKTGLLTSPTYQSLNDGTWSSAIRIVPPTNDGQAQLSGTYKHIQQIDEMQSPADPHSTQPHCNPLAQQFKQALQKQLKVLFKQHGWNPKGVIHTIRVAKRAAGGNGWDDNNCGCGCSAANV